MRHDVVSRTVLDRRARLNCWLCGILLAFAGAAASARGADALASKPATVAEAAKVIDLATFPLVPGAEVKNRHRSATQSYQAPGPANKAFDFLKQKLIAAKWKELPNSSVTAQSANATFARGEYRLSVSAFEAGKPGMVLVSMMNHGNIDVAKLPVPKDARQLYSGPVSIAHVTSEPVEKTAAAVNKLLLGQGWEPYGTAGDQKFFRQNAIRLSARVSAAPAQGGKTMIDYSTELMSAEIPAPVDTIGLQYADITARLMFDTAAEKDEIFAFYRKALASTGWEATTEKPFKTGFKETMIFRNGPKDMMTLETYTVDGKLRVIVQFQAAAEIAELEAELQAQNDRKKKGKDEKAAKKGPAEATITLPAGAKDVKREKDSIEFTVAAGKGKAAADDLRKQFVKAGWKEVLATLEEMFGLISISKGDQEASIKFVDTGFMPAKITISGAAIDAVAKSKE
ncbi:MAG: hypothetical protein HY290_29260 [Planctomycetia bacterium]|nr:hypothetical protein [Planctomycetia bacterium]